MNLMIAIMLTKFLLAFTMLIQGLELLSLSRKNILLSIWSFKNLSSDLYRGLPFPPRLVEILFSDKSFKIVIAAQIIAALGAMMFSSTFCLLILFFTHLLICIRFRGTFNGGSDMMTFVVLTGVIVAQASFSEDVQKFALLYVAVHALYSYFKAGLVKLKNKDWRSGRALPIFLKQSLLLDMQKLALWLRERPMVSRALCWSVIVFELSSILLPFLSYVFIFYFLIAVFFHFSIYASFGLNRFFWIWMSSWPAIFYSMTLV